jgi:UDP-N-acetylglucosamine 2-epimerase (non-hydrolysing)
MGHTGQQCDSAGTHAEQTGRVIVGFEKVCLEERPELVVVAGDVNATMACSIVAAKLLIPSAHIEAGPLSFDRTMPEEINRIVTDRLSDLLLTPSADGDENLLREGADPARIRRVGTR